VTRQLLTGNAAAAWGARLAGVDYVPAFPITPQTEILETLGAWIEAGELEARLVLLESEHSMLTAAGAAAATGVRVFSATSSQGLLYAMEMVYAVAGWRAPFVLVNVSRGVASPVTLESDHTDVLAARDSGFLQLHAATAQEVLDLVLLAYRLAEDSRVRLPALVNLDGFLLSFTREPVDVPDAEAAARFVGPFEPGSIRFRASRPISQAVAVLGGSAYSYFRYEMHRAAEAASEAWAEHAAAFESAFGRSCSALHAYRADDAEVVLFLIGSLATQAEDAVDRLREAGVRAGLVRPRLLRPWPAAALRAVLAGKRAVAVLDQDLSMGLGGVLHAELAAALYGASGAPPVLASFIGGLGGRDVSQDEFVAMAETALRAADAGEPPPPRLLYDETELRAIRKLQALALGERHELAGLGAPQPEDRAAPSRGEAT
jgi:pyruvate ferredoxin oxidoreductase alpha subunit